MISQEQLLQLIRHTFGAKAGNRQHDYLVLLVRLHKPAINVVIKLAGPGASMAGSFDRTAMLHHLVASQTTIPMPEILAVDVSYRTWPWRYLIKAYIPGQEWSVARRRMNMEELPDAYRQIGTAVAQLHSIHFPKFGELAADGSVEGDGQFPSAFRERAGRSIRNSGNRDLFLSVLDERKQLFQDIRQASLCHEDLHGHNLLFQRRRGQWRLVTILDFDKAWAGHHEIDLARLEFWRGMVGKEFWGAYEAVCPIAAEYESRRPIYQFLWCLEYARNTREHIRDTQRLCAQYGFPCPEDFE